jgi:hypothetical protein
MTISTFEEHIKALNPWEAKILQSTEHKKHKKLAQAILTTEKIDVVSDGGKAQGY